MPISINMNINIYKYIYWARTMVLQSFGPVGVFGVVVVAWCGDDVVVLSWWWCCHADCSTFLSPRSSDQN